MGQDLNKIEKLYDTVAKQYAERFTGEHEKKTEKSTKGLRSISRCRRKKMIDPGKEPVESRSGISAVVPVKLQNT